MWLAYVALPAVFILCAAYVALRAVRKIKKFDTCGDCKSCESCDLAGSCEELKKRKRNETPFVFNKTD